MTKVKICGITRLEDALLAAEFGADALGFNFYEPSSRYLAPQAAYEIIQSLSIDDVMKVGVFVNEETYTVGEVVDYAGLDAVQLHGDEDSEYIRELKRETDVEIIKAFRVSSEFHLESISQFEVDAVLLDAYSPEKYGGTGQRIDWSLARSVRELVADVYLAGGLTPDNVSEAITFVRPFAVDVAGGVESMPGKKDPVKLEAFINNAKKA